MAIAERAGMKILAMVAFSVLGAGCLASYAPGPVSTGGTDMAGPVGGGNGGGGGAGGGVGGNGGGDMARHMTGGGGAGGSGGGGGSGSGGGGGGGDMAMGSGGTNVAYGDNCIGTNPASQSNCATGLLCEQFASGAEHKCTKPCTMPRMNDPNECPAPSDTFCTPNMYCRMQ
jgi:hypothetical protein